ncbi:MAG: right-handed parallel beta-helix repeat-containing protein [Planctomycetota bacterium]
MAGGFEAAADAIESISGEAEIAVGVMSDTAADAGATGDLVVGACDGTNADPFTCPSGGQSCYELQASWSSPAPGGCPGGPCPPVSVAISLAGDDTLPDEVCASYSGTLSVEVVFEATSTLSVVSAPWVWSGRGTPAATLERLSGSGCLSPIFSGERWHVGPGRYRYRLSFDVFGPDNGVGPGSNLDVVLAVTSAVDCNGNCTPDAEDVEFGFSSDLDLDGVPDECEVAESTSFGPPEDDEGTGFGRAVAIASDGEMLAVGAPSSSVDGVVEGSVCLFEPQGGASWRAIQRLRSSTPVANGGFGIDVAVVGDRVLVAALSEGGNADGTGIASGAVHVFEGNDAGVHVHRQRLTPPSPSSGQAFGFGLSADGDWLAVGAYNDDAGGTNSGAVFLYEWSEAAGYEFRQTLIASPSAANQKFGVDTDLVDDVLVVGAYRDGTAGVFEAGAVYAFLRESSGVWTQTERILANPLVEDAWFGDRVALAPSTLLASASKEPAAGTAAGAAYLFDRGDGGFTQHRRVTAPAGGSGNWFGSGVAISGGRAIVGGRGVVSETGATGNAFVFASDDATWMLQETLPPPAPEVGSSYGWAVGVGNGSIVVGAAGGSGRCVIFDRFADCDGDGVDDDRQLDAGDTDCNGNLRLDTCEIASGDAADCNLNSVPDECEVAAGISTDIDADGVLDECEGYTIAVPGDFATLQAALDAIPEENASGIQWTISLSAGVYDGPFSTGGRSVAIEGENAATILQAEFGDTVLDANNGLGFWGFSSGSIALRDLTLRNGSKGAEIAGYESVVVERCRFESCVSTGLGIAGMQSFESVEVSDCIAVLCGTGFSIVNGWDVTLSNCLADQGEYGYWLSGNGPGSGGSVLNSCSSTNVFLAGLTVSNEYGVVAGGEYRDSTVGPGIESAWGLTISDATVSGNGTHGLTSGGDFYESETSVTDCTFSDNLGVGVFVSDVNDSGQFDGPTISGTFFGGNDIGVRIEGEMQVGGSVSGCTFTNSGTAIRANVEGAGLWISENTISGGGTALQVESQSPVSITSNEVSQAIQIGQVTVTGGDLTVTGNTFSESDSGLEIQWAGGFACEVAGNVFCGNGEPQVFGTFPDGGNTILPCCGAGAADSDGDGVVDCVDNCPSLSNASQADCDGDGTGDACEIASGSAADCNANGVPDACDIADGSSGDANGDGVPDECQQGTVVTVPGDFDSIQAAIDAAAEGWTIEVGPGTHVGAIALGAKAIVVASTDGASATVLDGAGAIGSVVAVSGASPSGESAVIRGFTITGGAGGTSIPAFGGVFGGGGVVAIGGSLRIESCIVEGNTAAFGGGVYAYGGVLEFVDSFIRGNESDFDGGGLLLYECAATLTDTVFEGNASGNRGGGVHAVRGTPIVAGCEFIDNDAVGFGGAIGWFAGDEPFVVGTTILAGNLAGIDGDAGWIRPGYSNLEASDLVVCGSGATPFAGEYTAAGTVLVEETCTDCDGNGLVDSWELLLGTAEDADGDGVIDACACPADFDGNGIVNGADLGVLLLGWGADGPADLDGNGVVDGADLGLALLAWGECDG